MLRELLSLFRAGDPLAEMGDNFARMLTLTQQMNIAAGEVFLGGDRRPSQREQIYAWDREVNALEQTIRRQVITHLSVPGHDVDLPYSLLLISLVKDVERLGDYAKNLAQLVDIRPDSLPEGPVLDELMEIRRRVEVAFQSSTNVFAGSKRDEATKLITQGRETARRCDQLITTVGRSDYDAATTTAFILGTRYYKRIGAHVLNVLSSVVMPLDKVDYYDETEFSASDPV